MKAQFNPYSQWLGLPENLTKPNLYQLLGLNVCEPDQAKIEKAAMERMKRVRTYQVLPEFSAIAIRVGNELGEAQAILCDPAEKQRYDSQLRSQETHVVEPSASDTWETLPTTKQPPPASSAPPKAAKPPPRVQQAVRPKLVPPPIQEVVPAEAIEVVTPGPKRNWVWWLLLIPRGVDWLLASLVGEDNEILHNFMRFVSVVVFLGGSYFGIQQISWDYSWFESEVAASVPSRVVTTPVSRQQPSPWLFDGKSFQGWQGDKELWQIEAGAFVCDTAATLKRASLRHERECSQFVLRLFCKQHHGNCSLLLGQATAGTNLEIFLTGSTAGSVWSESVSQFVVQTKLSDFEKLWQTGEWNEFVLLCDSQWLKLMLNGNAVFQYELDSGFQLPESSTLAFQVGSLGEASKVEFRDIELHPLPQLPTTANLPPVEDTPAEIELPSPLRQLLPPALTQGSPAPSTTPSPAVPPPVANSNPSAPSSPARSPQSKASQEELLEILRRRNIQFTPLQEPGKEVRYLATIFPGKLDTESLRLLEQLEDVIYLEMPKAQLTPEMLESLSRLNHIETLNLTESSISNLESLSQLNKLTYLFLRRTQISDEDLAVLSRMTQLKIIVLSETRVTPAAVNALRAQLPNCDIIGP